MVRYLMLDEHDARADEDMAPLIDERDVTTVVPDAVSEILEVAETWLGWDGRPVYAEGNA